MEIKYHANPNYRDSNSTHKIMLRLTFGLLLVYAFGLYNAYSFGVTYFVNSIIIMAVALVTALSTEAIWALVFKKNVLEYIKNSFGWVTAIIIALTVASDTQPYVICIVTFISIFFAKLVFGGFGQNVFNPAAIGRAVLASSFAGNKIVDVLTSATPTSTFDSFGWLISSNDFSVYLEDFNGLRGILLGFYNGAIGETSSLLIVLIAIYFAFTRVIDWRIPLTYVGIIFAGSTIIGLANGIGMTYPIVFTSTGGILFGAVFMLTDPVTNPTTTVGRVIYAGIAAICTVLIRIFGNLPDGVTFSIIIANMLAPMIDKFTMCKQTDREKFINIFIPLYIIFAIVIIWLCGFGLTVKPYDSVVNANQVNHVIVSDKTLSNTSFVEIKEVR